MKSVHFVVFAIIGAQYGVVWTTSLARAASDEEKLIAHLFENYNPTARPVLNSADTVLVHLQFSLLRIKELDLRSQVLSSTGSVILDWKDERLNWKPVDFANLTELRVESEKLWTPEFVVTNGAESMYQAYENFRAIITSDGLIHWEPAAIFKTMCYVDITYYPFDHQHCHFEFGSWSYTTHKMNLTTTASVVHMNSYSINGEWEITDTSAIRQEFYFECCLNERFSVITFDLGMRRRYNYYIMNVILPCILTSILLLLLFISPSDVKVEIGLVVLLSFQIFMLNVAESIPKISDQVPLLGIYLTCTMVISTLSMVSTVFILKLNRITDRPVPGWVRKVVLVCFATPLGMCSYTLKDPKQKKRRLITSSARSSFGQTLAQKSRTDLQSAEYDKHDDNVKNSVTEEFLELSHLKGESSVIFKSDTIESGTSGIQDDDFSKDWTRVAAVLDRLLFWLFLLAILISLLVLFHPLI